MFERVLVPLDGSPSAEQALEYGIAIAQKFGARLLLLSAYEDAERAVRALAMASGAQPGGILAPATIEAVTRAAQEQESETRAYLDGLTERLRTRGLAVDAVAVDGEPADAILNEAHRASGTVVVMTTHGRGGLERLVFGSVAQSVLARCRAPVLLVRIAEHLISKAGHDIGADVTIGADVLGTDGKLGEVSRVIVAPGRGVTDITVRGGGLGGERVVPAGRITRIEGGTVYLDLDSEGARTLDELAEGQEGTPADRGGAAADGGRRTVLGAGLEVVDAGGEKVGEVSALSVAPKTGAPTRLVVRRGLLFKRDTEIPVAWVRAISGESVLLSVPRSRFEELEHADES